MKVFPLKCAVQSYEWGKIGNCSTVANLSKASDPNFLLDGNTPYAELWMGTHPKGPSVLASSGETLSEWIKKNQQHLGGKVNAKFPSAGAEGQLPFLFKVLSVNISLSIQAHPNKSHAEQLHREKPDKYPDPNHKPEMAIALTPFEGMCGFRPKEEILGFLKNVHELAAVIDAPLVEALEKSVSQADVSSSLQNCFTALMTCDSEKVKVHLSTLVARLQNDGSPGDDAFGRAGRLLLRLHSQFPGDVGCFVSYFLNHITLQPGEAMFLEANLPHAYLSGDCMECMACSDNVVRAGLTPKFKDVEVLCSMLKYECKPGKDSLFPTKSHPSDPHVTVYDPPVPDFTVCQIKLPPEVKNYTISSVDSASILLVIKGEADSGSQSVQLHQGTVLFIAANEDVPLHVSSKGMLMFRAYC